MAEPSRLKIVGGDLTAMTEPSAEAEPCRRCKQPTTLSGWGARATPWVNMLCPTCLEAREQVRRAKRQGEVVALLEAAGVLPEHSWLTLDDFPSELATDLRRGIGAGCLINGLYGRGKTGLAAAIAREHVLAGGSLLSGMARKLLRRIRDTQSPAATETESRVIDALCGVDLLVFDDLGPDREGRPTEFVLGTLHEVLSERIGNRRSTIVTTNLPASQIEQHYGGAIASRLMALRLVTLGGADRRQRA